MGFTQCPRRLIGFQSLGDTTINIIWLIHIMRNLKIWTFTTQWQRCRMVGVEPQRIVHNRPIQCSNVSKVCYDQLYLLLPDKRLRKSIQYGLHPLHPPHKMSQKMSKQIRQVASLTCWSRPSQGWKRGRPEKSTSFWNHILHVSTPYFPSFAGSAHTRLPDPGGGTWISRTEWVTYLHVSVFQDAEDSFVWTSDPLNLWVSHHTLTVTLISGIKWQLQLLSIEYRILSFTPVLNI